MKISVRDEILKKLEIKDKSKNENIAEKIPQKIINEKELFDRFKDSLSLLSGEVYFAEGKIKTLETLLEILKKEDVKKIIKTNEGFIETLELKEWGNNHGIIVKQKGDFKDRKEFKEEIFDSVDAGITSADFAIAESGTLLAVFEEKNPRLISLAPPVHIAIVPFNKLVPFYEDAVLKTMDEKKPSQLALITGPSMTADIMATSFTGMHGPEKIYVIFVK